MPYVDITSDKHATYGTHSHGEEGFAAPGGQYPAQLKWSDLHPPGVKVLPKGSPPAGPGEINWEDTLGGKFALALEKLEGLLYAVFGSRPNGNPKRQWYDRQHPRCLWGPEMWERRLLLAPPQCTQVGECWDYQPAGKEYAALGENPPCCLMPKPSVPIQSRSGDPARQFASGVHDREYFPLGSVSRNQADDPFDPEGSGWFGATQPGRQDGVGYVQKTGQAVTFYYEKPPTVPTPSVVRLYYSTKAPGGSWSPWFGVAMPLSGGKYQVSRGPYAHGTEFRWYVQYYKLGGIPTPPPVSKYDPGGDAPPAAANAYYLQWFTHFNPYAYGLPEMLESYGGVDVRHGTDFFRFDGAETIQPALINMVRFVLSWLGGDCCTGEYDTCAETDDRCDVFHHNPRFRGGDDGLCCVPMPIKFRWSGSNVHPHYMTGGKGLVGGPTPDPRPLHNHPNHVPGQGETWGSAGARKTWRGINMLYADDLHFDNPFYGGGYSWGTAPGTFVLMYKPNWESFAKVWAKYPSWGLRPGDVIEAVHIKEIIDAVDYLIDYGVWSRTHVCTRKRTPGTFMGKECGYHYDRVYEKWGPNEYNTETEGVDVWDKCCQSWTPDPPTCTPHPVPDLEECIQNCVQDKCIMRATKLGAAHYIAGSPPYSPWPCRREYHENTECDTDGTEYYGCGRHMALKACELDEGEGAGCQPWPDTHYECRRGVMGLSYYVCAPPACQGGWDADHGGIFKKNRLDHIWHPELWSKATGPPGNEASGNCLGDMLGCGDIFPPGTDVGLWFGEVAGVNWKGLVPSWYAGCDGLPPCSPTCEYGDTVALPPPVPGYGYTHPLGQHFCEQFINRPYSWQHRLQCSDGHDCRCWFSDFDVCDGQAVWVAVDLNLDGSGRPYRHFPGRNGGLPPYEGRGVPRLRNYDLTKNPATWMHDCPCETWTGAAMCVI